jgi:hypothetical protein
MICVLCIVMHTSVFVTVCIYCDIPYMYTHIPIIYEYSTIPAIAKKKKNETKSFLSFGKLLTNTINCNNNIIIRIIIYY